VWVRAADLYAAMRTPDADNGDASRGYVLVDASAPDARASSGQTSRAAPQAAAGTVE
jgi:hypothetical protein